MLSPDATSDQPAINLMRNVVAASGGLHAWSQVRSAKALYTSVDSHNAPHRSLLLDDWSSTNVRYCRGHEGSNVTRLHHDGRSSFNTSVNGKARQVPEFDQARILAHHIPAAAAEVILRTSSYLLKTVPNSECAQGYSCVDVYRRLSPHGPYLKEQEWELSSSSGLPDTIKLRLPDVLRGTKEIWESLSLRDYANKSSILVPHTIIAHMPGGSTQTRRLASINFGVPFDMQAFDKEVAQ